MQVEVSPNSLLSLESSNNYPEVVVRGTQRSPEIQVLLGRILGTTCTCSYFHSTGALSEVV